MHVYRDVVGQTVGEGRIRLRERDGDRAVVELLHPRGDDPVQRVRGLTRSLGVQHAIDREDQVVGGDVLAVVEGDTLPQADRPHGGVLVGRHLLGEPVVQLGVGGRPHEALVQIGRPAIVRVVDDRVGIARVGARAAGQPGVEAAAGLGRAGGRRRGPRRGGARRARGRAAAGRDQPSGSDGKTALRGVLEQTAASDKAHCSPSAFDGWTATDTRAAAFCRSDSRHPSSIAAAFSDIDT